MRTRKARSLERDVQVAVNATQAGEGKRLMICSSNSSRGRSVMSDIAMTGAMVTLYQQSIGTRLFSVPLIEGEQWRCEHSTGVNTRIENLAPDFVSPLRFVTRRPIGDLQKQGQDFQFLFS